MTTKILKRALEMAVKQLGAARFKYCFACPCIDEICADKTACSDNLTAYFIRKATAEIKAKEK